MKPVLHNIMLLTVFLSLAAFFSPVSACVSDGHGKCTGSCSSGYTCTNHAVYGCSCVQDNPPTSKPTNQPPVFTIAPTGNPTAIPCPNGVCPTNSPTGWNKPCDNGSYCGPGYYCCGVNNANCCEIGEVEPSNDPNPGASSTPGPSPTATPTITLTPSPTPTAAPGPWIKLKDTSFISKNSLYNHIPLAPLAFDADDDGSPYFIINSLLSSSGLVSAPSLNITGLNANAKPNATSQQLTYTTTYPLSPSSFISYVKSRKTYYTITSPGFC